MPRMMERVMSAIIPFSGVINETVGFRANSHILELDMDLYYMSPTMSTSPQNQWFWKVVRHCVTPTSLYSHPRLILRAV